MTATLRRLLTLLAGLLPGPLARGALRALGHRIGDRCPIGCSLLWLDRLTMQEGARIGHLNFVAVRRLAMRRGAYLGRLNLLHGPFSISLGECAAIGNGNKISRGERGAVTHGPARLRLGKLSKLTANHRVDCTASIVFGDYSTLAGTRSALWTHGYVHDLAGPGRYRVDGRIRVEDNVYIGAACTLTAGVRLASGVIVGAGAVVASDLPEAGLYVAAPLRRLDRPPDPASRADLQRADAPGLCDTVYVKKPRDR